MSTPSSIADAISSGFKLLKTVLDTKQVRTMRKAIEAGEKYIQVNTRTAEFTELDEDKQAKYLKHYSRRFFKYN
jgi:hypothetical protein